MFNPRTPKKPKTPSSKIPLQRGLYEDGQWKCNCSPKRKLAARRQVQKEGPNQGRHFYTCLSGTCQFFLWHEEARIREQQTPINSFASNAAPGPPNANQPVHYPTLPNTPSSRSIETGLFTPKTSPSKRGAAVAFDMDVVFSSDDENEKTANEADDPDSLSDEFVVFNNNDAQTLRKQCRTSLTSPSKRFRTSSGLVKDDPFTPSKGLAIDLHAVDINNSPTRRKLFQQQLKEPKSTMGQTPLQTQPTQLLLGSDLEGEILAVMNRIYGNTALPVELLEVIQRHARQKEGLLHGRDVVRKLYNAANMENQELKQKLASTERERDEARFLADMLEEEKREVHDLSMSIGKRRQKSGKRGLAVLRAYFDGTENATIYNSSQATVEDSDS